MTTHTHEEIIQAAIEEWGEKSQALICIEECAELQKALIKWMRYEGKSQMMSVLEELVDVQIMIDQLMLIFGCADNQAWYGNHVSPESIREKKMKRLESMLF